MADANTSGFQTQAWTPDELATTCKAITKLEVLSLAAGEFLRSPADCERIELLAYNEASYSLGRAGEPARAAAVGGRIHQSRGQHRLLCRLPWLN